MAKPKARLDDDESAIVVALYESPQVFFNTYLLAQTLHPKHAITAPESKAAFERVCRATEELIVKGLIKGKRAKGNDGIFYNDIQLTRKGEQEAIQERKQRSEFQKNLPKLIKDANSVAKEIAEAEAKRGNG